MTAMTAERTAAPVITQPQSAGSLAIRADQTIWSPQQEAVLRQSGISDEVTAAELAGFLHLCQRTGLDPFSRQIYLIGRYDKRKQRTVFTPQTGIDGYRVIAQRVTGQTGGTYGYEDTLWCDQGGRWRDVWLSDEPPAAAKVTVIRNGARFSAVARFSEYAETWPDGNLKSMWAKMPAGQIAKCCEALALRKAFPHDLAGVYTAEEMAQADNPEPAQQFQRQQPQAADQWQQATPAPAAQASAPRSDAEIAADDARARDEMFRAARDAALTPEQADAGFKARYGAFAVYGTAQQLREYAASLAAVQAPPAPEQQDADLSPQARAFLANARNARTPDAFAAVRADAERAGAPAPFLARLDRIAAEKQQAEHAANLAAHGADPATGDGNEFPVYTGPADGSDPGEEDGPTGVGGYVEPLPGAPATVNDRLDTIAAMYAAGEAAGLSQVETRNVLAKETRHTLSDASHEEIVRVTADLRAAGGAR